MEADWISEHATISTPAHAATSHHGGYSLRVELVDASLGHWKVLRDGVAIGSPIPGMAAAKSAAVLSAR